MNTTAGAYRAGTCIVDRLESARPPVTTVCYDYVQVPVIYRYETHCRSAPISPYQRLKASR
jgi:hypothetical protein